MLFPIIESRHTYECVTPHIWMWRGTHVNESRHTITVSTLEPSRNLDFLDIWMSYVTHMNESCHPYEWVMSQIKSVTSHVCSVYSGTINKPWMFLTYDWVTLPIRMSNVTHVNESCHTYEWVASHICSVYSGTIKKSWMFLPVTPTLSEFALQVGGFTRVLQCLSVFPICTYCSALFVVCCLVFYNTLQHTFFSISLVFSHVCCRV